MNTSFNDQTEVLLHIYARIFRVYDNMTETDFYKTLDSIKTWSDLMLHVNLHQSEVIAAARKRADKNKKIFAAVKDDGPSLKFDVQM